MRRILSFTILAVVLTAAAVPAQAAGLTGAGLQIGWSTNPDDFLIGFHYEARPLGEELDLVPSIDFGFGDVTMIAPNLDAHYVLKTSSKLRPYIGGWHDVPLVRLRRRKRVGIRRGLIGGLHVNSNMAFEAKYGLGDAPDWKFVFLLHK